jgi:hypothetical protein
MTNDEQHPLQVELVLSVGDGTLMMMQVDAHSFTNAFTSLSASERACSIQAGREALAAQGTGSCSGGFGSHQRDEKCFFHWCERNK